MSLSDTCLDVDYLEVRILRDLWVLRNLVVSIWGGRAIVFHFLGSLGGASLRFLDCGGVGGFWVYIFFRSNPGQRKKIFHGSLSYLVLEFSDLSSFRPNFLLLWHRTGVSPCRLRDAVEKLIWGVALGGVVGPESILDLQMDFGAVGACFLFA